MKAQCSLALLALILPARAGVLVVDAAGGGAFTDIQPAVDAALDGDTLLVKHGSYTGFLVDQKSLSIVGDTSAVVSISGGVRLRNLPKQGFVLLANLRATGMPNSGASSFGLWCADNRGNVRVEGCEFTGALQPLEMLDAPAGARIELCARVALVRSALRGGATAGADAFYGINHAGAGLSSAGSELSLHECQLAGGQGGNALGGVFLDGSHGGPGLEGLSSTLSLAGCLLVGGAGGHGSPLLPPASSGGDGGAGSVLAGCTARVLDAVEGGGQGGWGYWNGQHHLPFDGADGLARAGAPGQYVDLAGALRSVLVPAPVRESTNPVLSFAGVAGDQVYLWIGSAPAFAWWGAGLGQRLVLGRAPHMTHFVGEIPAGGTPITTRVPWEDLGLGVESALGFYQALFRDTAGQWRLGSAGTMLVLDSAY